MKTVQFDPDKDFDRLEGYLRDRYLESCEATSWLPERLHDLIYRVGAQEMDEGRERSADHIYLWEENGEIAACILPDGENIYVSIKRGFESLFPSVIDFSEKYCRSLFSGAADGSVKFWVAVSERFAYMQEMLTGLGFHPDYESPDYKAGMNPYDARKHSPIYRDSFECVIVDENTTERNDVCAYCFVYVDKRTKTALIEPLSTREKYRHKGFGTAMLHGAIRRCKERGIEKCYVDAFGEWRKEFHSAAGSSAEDSIGFWYKTLR